MRLSRLSLTNFRAFTRLDAEFPRRILLLIGDNAQGKTSLLEAIFYLATFASFHTQSEKQLISFDAGSGDLAIARIVAEVEKKSKTTRMEVRLIQEAGSNGTPRLRKEILVDGVKRKAVQALGEINAVIFLPQMMRILEGSPEDRRRYINMVLCQVIPGYGQALSTYARAMEQRNALLKLLAERGGDESQLDYWDAQLAENGARILSNRCKALQDLDKTAASIHLRLTSGSEVLRLRYLPSFDLISSRKEENGQPAETDGGPAEMTEDETREGLLNRYLATRKADLQRGVTQIGPHRDELRVSANGIDLGDYGSRGQVRTALLAIKLAEVEWMKARTGEFPLLLLDETLAELDPIRRNDLLDTVAACEQTILTATDLSHFPANFLASAARWTVTTGRVQTEPDPIS